MVFKILVPYDGSRPSDNALNHAVMMAKLLRKDALVILLNVVQEIPVPPMMFQSRIRSPRTGEQASIPEVWKELHQEMKINAIKMLEEKKKEMESDAIEIRTSVLVGYPADKIIEFAKDEKADLIIIGNVGLSGLSKVKTLGSVSRAVSENAKCPVMIVH